LNIFSQIERYAHSDEKKIVLETETEQLSYKELYYLLVYNQKVLEDNGYKPEDRVVILIKCQKNFIIQLLSLLSMGCWITPVVPEIESNLCQILLDTGGRVVEEELLADRYSNSISMEGRLIINNSENCGIFHMTSGTTGKSKYCIRTLRALGEEGECFRKTLALQESDKIFSVPPIYHSYALGAALMAALVSGASVLVSDKFIPRQILKKIHNFKTTIVLLVPIMAKLLTEVRVEEMYDVSSVRIALVGAGPISRELYQNFSDRFGIRLSSNYGSTETGGLISRVESIMYESIGKPMIGVKLKIVDGYGREVACKEKGEIMVKSIGMQRGYLGEKTSLFDEEGYWPTGDIGMCDENGNVFIVGRLKNMINVGGKKVIPSEVEDTILKMPNVKECAVAGYRKDSGEEAIKAFIVMKKDNSNYSKEDVRMFCSQNLSQYKIPSIVEFINELPRNQMGKVLYRNLQ